MSGLFAFRSSGDPWFRLGRLEVTTTMAVVLAVAASWLMWVAIPALSLLLAYTPSAAASGELWRIVTWPLANGLSIWAVLNLFFFWYFGTDLENTLGRARMLRLLVGMWAALTAAATLVGLLIGGTGLAGIGLIQFLVLLLWIAEYPRRPFFFGIPAWVIGVVLVGVQVFGLIAARNGASLLSLLLSLVLVAMVARHMGLLGEHAWIPGARRPGRTPQARQGRPSRLSRKGKAGRPGAARPEAGAERRAASDREKLDALLDRISDHGIDSLSAAERRELMRLRDRLRGA